MLDPSILIGASTIPTAIGIGKDGTTVPTAVDPAISQARQEAAIAQRQAKVLAAALEIQSSLDIHGDLGSVAIRAAQHIADALPGYRIQIAWRMKAQSVCLLIADSEVQQTPSATWTAAAEEIVCRNATTIFPPTETTNRHALLAVAQFVRTLSGETDAAERSRTSSIVGVPMVDHHGNTSGALIAIANEPAAVDATSCATQLQAIATGLANKLRAIQATQPSQWESTLRTLTSSEYLKQRRVGFVAALLFLAGMLVPVPYKVTATCELQPVQRRMIAASLDGPLQSVNVRPGDNVMEGDVLATINPREVDFQLASLDAELRGAISEQKGLIAKHDVGGGEVAGLEAKRLQFQQELLSHRRQNVEIRSPLTGMVVAGDLKPSVGSPVSKGDPLFEVAPLEQMVVEIAIPERDYEHVRCDMDARIQLDAIPSQVFHGRIRYVHPSAELIEGDNVFIAEVALENPHGLLRPGMRGRVRVKSDRHPMGWNLFHRAFHAIRGTLGW